MKTVCAAGFALSLSCMVSVLSAQDEPIQGSPVGVPSTPNLDTVSPATSGDWNLAGSIRAQWVLLDESKTLHGRIGTLDGSGSFNGAANLEVRLYQSDGSGVTWQGERNGQQRRIPHPKPVGRRLSTNCNGSERFPCLLHDCIRTRRWRRKRAPAQSISPASRSSSDGSRGSNRRGRGCRTANVHLAQPDSRRSIS